MLKALLRLKHGPTLHVLAAHLKSTRPKFLQNDAGEWLEDRDDPIVATRATLRSLLMRAAEAAALRRIVIDVLLRTRDPLVLLGDLNDAPHAATSQLIAATGAAAYDRDARDVDRTVLDDAVDVDEVLVRIPAQSQRVERGVLEIVHLVVEAHRHVPAARAADARLDVEVVEARRVRGGSPRAGEQQRGDAAEKGRAPCGTAPGATHCFADPS